MIISKTPFRVSFVGGGTDIANYYEKHGGGVVSCAINRHVYVTVSPRDDGRIVLSYSRLEAVDQIIDIQNELVRKCLVYLGIPPGIEIHIISDISTVGTGLGGSSAVTVGLLNALHYYKGEGGVPPGALAKEACEVEIGWMKKCIGKQDQYICALGGLRHISFREDGRVDSEPVSDIPLKNRLFLLPYQVEKRTKAEDLLARQHERLSDNLPILHKMGDQCEPFVKALRQKKVGRLIDEVNQGWQLKRRLSDIISDDGLDRLIENYAKKGYGAKLCGAGQSGFVMLLSKNGQLTEGAMPVSISEKGSRIVHAD